MKKRRTDTQYEYYRLKKKHDLLARKADDRLRALEKASKKKEFKNVLNYAYKSAIRAIRSWSGGKGKNRFKKTAPKRIDQLRSKIRDIEEFLAKPSSLTTEIKRIYKSRADKLNKRFGTNFSWEDLGDFFESPEYQRGAEDFGYSTYIKSVGVLQDNEEELVKALKNNERINFDIKNDLVEDAVNKLLDKYGLDFTKLY